MVYLKKLIEQNGNIFGNMLHNDMNKLNIPELYVLK